MTGRSEERATRRVMRKVRRSERGGRVEPQNKVFTCNYYISFFFFLFLFGFLSFFIYLKCPTCSECESK